MRTKDSLLHLDLENIQRQQNDLSDTSESIVDARVSTDRVRRNADRIRNRLSPICRR